MRPTPASQRPRHILPVIVISQFAGTSLWFASNGVMPDLQASWGLGREAIGYTTSAVQFGFIAGTLLFSILTIADRFSPRVVFFACAVLGAVSNFMIRAFADGLTSLLILRFATGFFLAGIYPVGMKIAASWYERGLGEALGWLVGAVVAGTAFPHLLRGAGVSLPWETVIVTISAVAAAGGVLLLALVPDGPFSKRGAKLDLRAAFSVFRSGDLRAAAFGYFGHMWELYTVWAFVPVVVAGYAAKSSITVNVSLWSFVMIGVGAVGCVLGGLASNRLGSARVAAWQLGVSGVCCLLSPFMFFLPPVLFFTYLIVWGVAVVGDSPQYSALTAVTAPQHLVGSALTIVTSVGFLLTIPSLELVNWLVAHLPSRFVYLALVPGPALGLVALARFRGTPLGTGRVFR
jgi:predicted MFS family arabinose efflux permease